MIERAPRFLMLDPRELAPFEIGARLLAILAFPSPADEDAYEEAAQALSAAVVFNTIAMDPEGQDWWRATYPDYATIDEPEIRRRLRTLPRRHRDRMVAARMSLAFFEEGFTGQPARLPPSMARLSLNELSKLVQSQSGESDPENIERRSWHDSGLVIHLAAAMQVAARALGRPQDSAFGYDIHNAELHRFTVWLTKQHEDIVLLDQRFGARRDSLIRIRLASGLAG